VYRVSLDDLVPVNLNVPGFTGMSFGTAGAGHWGCYLATSQRERQHCTKDGVPFHPEIKQYGCCVFGNHLLTADMSNNYVLMHFVGNDLNRRLPSDNKWRVNEYGDITTGYYGPVHLYPFGEGHIDATITPWRREEPGPPVRVDGELWLWTASDDAEQGLILGRRVGEKLPIVLRDFPSVQTDAVWTGQEFVIAGNSDKGALQVRWVSKDAPRESLSIHRPVRPLATLPSSRWGGYFKVKGRYGDWTGDAKAVGATLILSGLSDESGNLTFAQKAAEQTKWLTKCRNTGIAVSCGTERVEIEVYKPFWDIVACIYVTVEGSGIAWNDIGAVERKVKETEAILDELGLARRPFMLYIDGDLSRGGYRWPAGIDWQAINLYLGPESPATSAEAIKQLTALWNRQQALIPKDKKLVLICQAYDRNGAWKNIDILMDMQPEYHSFMQDSRCVGAFFFAYSRPGGVTTYPDLASWHKEIFKSIPTKPPIITIKNPKAPPKFTIVSYEPKSGIVPLKVKAIYKAELGAGKIDTIQWRVRQEGASQWIVAATNPGWDPDHTYTFEVPGRYEIGAKTSGPGGTWETGAKRVVEAFPFVAGPVEPEPPELPTEPPVTAPTPPPVTPPKLSQWQKFLIWLKTRLKT
jgi:hypothetical protein